MPSHEVLIIDKFKQKLREHTNLDESHPDKSAIPVIDILQVQLSPTELTNKIRFK